jgi:hypothetical protein
MNLGATLNEATQTRTIVFTYHIKHRLATLLNAGGNAISTFC